MNANSSNNTLMRSVLVKAALIIVSLGVAMGCGGGKVSKSGTVLVPVDLTRDQNFKLLKTRATGYSDGFKLLMAIELVSPSLAAAQQNLLQTNGFAGKPNIQLVNIVQDRVTLWNAIVCGEVRLNVTADVIEYEGHVHQITTKPAEKAPTRKMPAKK